MQDKRGNKLVESAPAVAVAFDSSSSKPDIRLLSPVATSERPNIAEMVASGWQEEDVLDEGAKASEGLPNSPYTMSQERSPYI